jgi:hypothetical protein
MRYTALPAAASRPSARARVCAATRTHSVGLRRELVFGVVLYHATKGRSREREWHLASSAPCMKRGRRHNATAMGPHLGTEPFALPVHNNHRLDKRNERVHLRRDAGDAESDRTVEVKYADAFLRSGVRTVFLHSVPNTQIAGNLKCTIHMRQYRARCRL